MKSCECCGREFTQHIRFPNQRFCSRTCQNRQRHLDERARRRTPKPKTCAACGEPLPEYVRNRPRKFCSKLCKYRFENWTKSNSPRPGVKVRWSASPRLTIQGVMVTRTTGKAVMLANGGLYEVPTNPKKLRVI